MVIDGAAHAVAERQCLGDCDWGVNAPDHPANFRTARGLRKTRICLGNHADQRACVVERVGREVGIEHGLAGDIVATSSGQRLGNTVERAANQGGIERVAVIGRRCTIGTNAPRLAQAPMLVWCSARPTMAVACAVCSNITQPSRVQSSSYRSIRR